MQFNGSWLALLGAVSLSLLPSVSADTQISDPNWAVIRQFNIVLTDNTKVNDLFCCMGTSTELPSTDKYKCFDHQALQMGLAPGSRRMGIQYCHHLPGSTPDQATADFKDTCTKATGEVINPDKGYCPQIWPNYKDDYKKPAPAPAPAPDAGHDAPTRAAQPAPAPDASGKGTNDKDGFKTQGTFMYSIVDYSITRSLACCKASKAPIVTPQKYKCAQRKVANSVFIQQCAKILPIITKRKKLDGYTTLNGPDDAIVDDKTKQQCSAMWTNAMSYTYGFCKLDYDYAADEAVKAFGDDCAAKGGESKEPHNGMCLWNVDDAADDSSTG
ncbi:hypothetical protein NDA16_000909 [Ustilago loliicola]|nr:hypothetical protein NDA16_000909 [Ustilago loliicola]